MPNIGTVEGSLVLRNQFSKEVRRAVKDLGNFQSKAREALGGVDKSGKKAELSGERLAKAYRRLVHSIDPVKRSMDRLEAAQELLRLGQKKLGVDTETHARRMAMVQSHFERSARGMSNLELAMRRFGRSIFSLAAAVLILHKIRNALNGIVQASLQMDRIERAAKVTGANLKFLEIQSNRLGVAFAETAQRMGQLSIAFRQAGLTTRDVEESYLAVSEAALVLGLDAQRTELAFLAIQQIASKGVVSMEELRRQLGEQIPGALGMMAKGLDITLPQLFKMVEQGELLAKDALPALFSELRKTFGPQVSEAAKSTQASIARLKNEIFLLKNALAETADLAQIFGAQSELVRGIRLLIENWEVLRERVEEFNNSLTGRAFEAPLLPILAAMQPIRDFFREAAELSKKLNESGERRRAMIERNAKATRDAVDLLAGQIGRQKALNLVMGQHGIVIDETTKKAKFLSTGLVGAFKSGKIAADEFEATVTALRLDKLKLEWNSFSKEVESTEEIAAALQRKMNANIENYGEAIKEAEKRLEKRKDLLLEIGTIEEKRAITIERALKKAKELGLSDLHTKQLIVAELAKLVKGVTKLNDKEDESLKILLKKLKALKKINEEGAKIAEKQRKEDLSLRLFVREMQELERISRRRRDVEFDTLDQNAKVNILIQESIELANELGMSETARIALLKEQLRQLRLQKSEMADMADLVSNLDRLAVGFSEAAEFAFSVDNRPLGQGFERLAAGMQAVAAKTDDATARLLGFEDGTDALNKGITESIVGVFDLAKGLGLMSEDAAKGAQAVARIGAAIGQAFGNEAIGSAIGGLLGAFGVDLGMAGQGAASGALIGAQFGGPVGAGIGLAVGAAVGFIGDMMQDTAEGFADLATTADGIVNNPAFGELSGAAKQFNDTIESVVEDILETLGGTFAEFNTLGFLIREDSKGIRVAWNGVWHQFGEDMKGAIDFAITTILRETDLTGVSDVARSALANAAFDTVEELQEVLQTILDIEATGVTQYGQQLIAESRRFNQLLQAAIFEIGEGADMVLNGPQGMVASFRNSFNQLFGIQQSAGEVRRAEIQALKAQMEVQRAHLLVLKAQIEGELAAAEARGETTRLMLQANEAMLTGIEVGAEGIAQFGRAIGGLAQVSAASTGVLIGGMEALAAITEALADIDELLAGFTPEAIQRAIRQAEAAARGGIDTSAQDQARRDTLLFESELAELRAQGASEGRISAMQFERQMEQLAESMRDSGIEELVIQRRLENEEILRTIDLTRQAIDSVRSFTDILTEAEFGEFGARFIDLADRVRDMMQGLFDSMEAGASPSEIARLLSDMGEALPRHISEMLATALERAANDPEAIADMQESLRALLADLPSELEPIRDLLVEALDDLSVAAEQAAESVRMDFLQSLVDMGVEIPGFAEAMIRMRFAEARARAIELFAGQAHQKSLIRGAEITKQVAQAHLTIWAEWGNKMIEIVGGVASRTADLLGALGGIVRDQNFDDIIVFGDTTLQELLDLLAEAEQAAIDALGGLGDDLNDSAGVFSDAAQAWEDALDRARSFLERLEDQLAPDDVFSRILRDIQRQREEAIEIGDAAFRALGTSLAEVLQQLELLQQIRLDEAWQDATEGLRNFLRELTEGPLSNLTTREQTAAAEARLRDLIARAQAGDLEAIEQLEREGRNLLDLAAQSLSGAGLDQLRNLLISVIPGILDLGPGGVVPGIGPPGIEGPLSTTAPISDRTVDDVVDATEGLLALETIASSRREEQLFDLIAETTNVKQQILLLRQDLSGLSLPSPGG